MLPHILVFQLTVFLFDRYSWYLQKYVYIYFFLKFFYTYGFVRYPFIHTLLFLLCLFGDFSVSDNTELFCCVRHSIIQCSWAVSLLPLLTKKPCGYSCLETLVYTSRLWGEKSSGREPAVSCLLPPDLSESRSVLCARHFAWPRAHHRWCHSSACRRGGPSGSSQSPRCPWDEDSRLPWVPEDFLHCGFDSIRWTLCVIRISS